MLNRAELLEISADGKFAKVRTFEDVVHNKVLLIYPYGLFSKEKVEEGSFVLLCKGFNSNTQLFGIPYNPKLQSEDLKDGEVEIGNFSEGNNKIKFKEDGSIFWKE